MEKPKPVQLTPAEMIRHYIQIMLNSAGDGWHLGQYVMCMSLERVTRDGQLETTPWVWSPPDQADWMTDGLMQACMDLRQTCDIHNDDD